MKGAAETPSVTINAHIPMYRALSLLKKVSFTTAVPIAAGGLMKKAVIARHTAMEV